MAGSDCRSRKFVVATTMRPAQASATIAVVEAVREIVVAVEPGTGSPSGAVRVGIAPERHFEGWLGLLSALQAAITELPTQTGSERKLA